MDVAHTGPASQRTHSLVEPGTSQRFLRSGIPQDVLITNNILRSRWNWQYNRELSLRVILQYDALLTNRNLTSLETTKNVNADILLTYLVNPWTALFVGYNGNAQNLELVPTATGADIAHPRRRLINDAKQFFIKFSYLFRF